jgi:hypothetical protein
MFKSREESTREAKFWKNSPDTWSPDSFYSSYPQVIELPAMPSHVKAAAPKSKGKISFGAQNKAPVASGSNFKRKRPAPTSDGEGEDEDDEDDDDLDDEADVESEGDTEDELATAQNGKSKKTASE